MEISDFSTTDANNNASNQFPENMLFSAVNNNLRGLMGAIARHEADTNGTLVSTGSAGNYALAANRVGFTLTQGLTFRFIANHTGTTGTVATLAVTPSGGSALTQVNIQDQNGNNIDPSQILEDGVYTVVYHADNEGFMLLDTPPNAVLSLTDDTKTIGYLSGLGLLVDNSPPSNIPDMQANSASGAAHTLATLGFRLNPISASSSVTLSARQSGSLVMFTGSGGRTLTLDSTFTAANGAFALVVEMFASTPTGFTVTASDGAVSVYQPTGGDAEVSDEHEMFLVVVCDTGSSAREVIVRKISLTPS